MTQENKVLQPLSSQLLQKQLEQLQQQQRNLLRQLYQQRKLEKAKAQQQDSQQQEQNKGGHVSAQDILLPPPPPLLPPTQQTLLPTTQLPPQVSMLPDQQTQLVPSADLHQVVDTTSLITAESPLASKNKSWVQLLILVASMICLMYVFICCISLLTDCFRLLFSSSYGDVLDSNNLKNPLLAMMMGVIGTTLIQSSSTVTSVIVALVGSGALSVRQGIPVIMGSNVGTTVTCILVSLTRIKNREEYVRGFVAAVIHGLFNWFTVLVLLPIEVAFGFLEFVTEKLVSHIPTRSTTDFQLLSYLVEPVVEAIIRLKNEEHLDIKDLDIGFISNSTGEFEEDNLLYTVGFNDSSFLHPNHSEPPEAQFTLLETNCEIGCNYIFYNSGLSDTEVGGILLCVLVIVLLLCFFLLVRTLRKLLQLHLSNLIKRVVAQCESNPTSKTIYGYSFILAGAVITILLQSSTVFTATLVPLVSSGFIRIEMAYALTLGSNLGTTTTGILAAMSSHINQKLTLQMAFCHLLFNLFGIAIFYIIPVLRLPLSVARIFGQKVIKYRWFSIFYMLASYIILPLTIYGISTGGVNCMYIVLIPAGTVFCLVILINYVQVKKPALLPKVLRDWSFLPKPLRTFSTIDYIVQTYMEVFCCCIVTRTVAAVPVFKGPPNLMGDPSLLDTKLDQELKDIQVEESNRTKKISAVFVKKLSQAVSPLPTALTSDDMMRYSARPQTQAPAGLFAGKINDDVQLVQINKQRSHQTIGEILGETPLPR